MFSNFQFIFVFGLLAFVLGQDVSAPGKLFVSRKKYPFLSQRPGEQPR
jgi:hypothetical protein